MIRISSIFPKRASHYNLKKIIMKKQDLSKEEINAILDQFTDWFSHPDVVGIDLGADESGEIQLEVDQLEESESIEAADLATDPVDFTLPEFVEITLQSQSLSSPSTHGSLPERIPVKVNRVSEDIEDELIDGSDELSALTLADPVMAASLARIRPAPGGYFIRTEGMKGRGSLGVSINYRGHYRILSNNHVIAKNGNIGKWVYQPDRVRPDNQLARVSGYDPIQYYKRKKQRSPVYNVHDVAWCDSDAQISKQAVREIGPVAGWREPVMNEEIWFFGARTQTLRSAKIVSLTRRYRSKGSLGYSWWKDGIKLDRSISQSGDSGTAYVAQSDQMVVALHRSGSKSYSTGCPL